MEENNKNMEKNEENFVEKYDSEESRNLEIDKIDKRRIKKKNHSAIRLAVDSVFDERTFFLLRKLLDKQIIGEFIGIINAGKEANVYLAYDKEGNEIALKIYKIDSNTSRWMRNYIIGDPRFKKVGRKPSQVIFLWAQKEYKNLKQAYRAGLSVPQPIYVKNNVLIMEYIGKGPTPAPLLKNIKKIENPQILFNEIYQFIRDLYKARLVHGDLSEFNILIHKKRPIMIDISQAVSIDHPKSDQYLIRDLKNVIKFFSKFDIESPKLKDAFFEIITQQ